MESKFKVKAIFLCRENIMHENDIDFIKFCTQYFKNIAKRKKTPNPFKLEGYGLSEYAVYDSTPLVDDVLIACVAYCKKTKCPIIVLHEFFEELPENAKNFIIHHEVSHLRNSEYFTNKSDADEYKKQRIDYINKNEVQPSELVADSFAADSIGKDEALEALSFLT